jgi:hypothetical protein
MATRKLTPPRPGGEAAPTLMDYRNQLANALDNLEALSALVLALGMAGDGGEVEPKAILAIAESLDRHVGLALAAEAARDAAEEGRRPSGSPVPAAAGDGHAEHVARFQRAVTILDDAASEHGWRARSFATSLVHLSACPNVIQPADLAAVAGELRRHVAGLDEAVAAAHAALVEEARA